MPTNSLSPRKTLQQKSEVAELHSDTKPLWTGGSRMVHRKILREGRKGPFYLYGARNKKWMTVTIQLSTLEPCHPSVTFTKNFLKWKLFLHFIDEKIKTHQAKYVPWSHTINKQECLKLEHQSVQIHILPHSCVVKRNGEETRRKQEKKPRMSSVTYFICSEYRSKIKQSPRIKPGFLLYTHSTVNFSLLSPRPMETYFPH